MNTLLPTPATLEKRQHLQTFIQQVLAPAESVQAVIAIGSLATGLARSDSDIDAVIFLEPFDAYIAPAEFLWLPSDGSFHSIFSGDARIQGEGLAFDFDRLDLARWTDPAFSWPEGYCHQLSRGWLAFDRRGDVANLIAKRTAYTDTIRLVRLDEAITWMDQHLSEDGPQVRWDSLGPAIAHDRLQAAYDYLVQALFAYNRCWRPWRNREMSALLALPWLPENFANSVLTALNAPSHDYAGYTTRAATLNTLFHVILDQLTADGVYSNNPIEEAFIRSHEEPGRAWNMAEWNEKHAHREKGEENQP